MSKPTAECTFTYRAFISYSHADKAWADWLHKALETYRIPARLVGTKTATGTIPRRLNPVFRDRDELASAAELDRKINEALAQSENLIVLCSPASAASRWVNEEVLAYKRMGRGERIFCVIVDGEPNATDLPGRAGEECFCPALRFKLDANGQPTQKPTEPIAADARPGGDGKPNAKLKLIAGMLDVGFDALKQRELQRRTRRMTAIAMLALVVMAATSGLAIYALVSRHRAITAENQAEVARREAVTAQATAETQQKHAEKLVYFMLNDLIAKLEVDGKGLGITDDVYTKVVAYFKSLPPQAMNDAALENRILVLDRVGDTRMREGRLNDALAAFNVAIPIASRLAATAPENVARQVEYSRILTYVCMIHLRSGKFTDAQHACDSARSTLQQSLRRAPANMDVLQQLAYVENDSGHVSQSLGDLAKANARFDAFLMIARKLISTQPDDPGLWPILIIAHRNLAGLFTLRGDLAAAIAHDRAATTAGDAGASQFPKTGLLLDYANKARASFGNALPLIGDSAAGIQNLRKAIAIEEKLIRTDPSNTDFQSSMGLYTTQLAQWQRLGGNLQQAKRLNTQSVLILAALVKKDAGNTDWQINYAAALTEQAAEFLASDAARAARTSAKVALRITEAIRAKDPEDRDALLSWVDAKMMLASSTDTPGAARSLREQALQTMQAVTIGRDDPRLLALQVKALLALDRKGDAQPLIKQLWGEGYRDPTLLAALQRARISYPVNTAFQATLQTAMTRVADGDVAPHNAAKGNR